MSDGLLTLEQARANLAWYTKGGQVPGDVLHKALRTAIAAMEENAKLRVILDDARDELLQNHSEESRAIRAMIQKALEAKP